MTPEQAYVLADERSQVFIPPAWEVVASLWADEAKMTHAFRTGAGVSWGDHDDRLFCGVPAFYRNGYRASLVPEWLPELDPVVDKLTAGARVADVGGGHGHSTLIMAEAFPNSRFFGFDAHAPSIEIARGMAREAGLEDRVSFAVTDASRPLPGPFDPTCFFDCLHDLGRPVEAARRAREALAPDGTLMPVEPYASDKVEENLNPVGRMYCAASSTRRARRGSTGSTAPRAFPASAARRRRRSTSSSKRGRDGSPAGEEARQDGERRHIGRHRGEGRTARGHLPPRESGRRQRTSDRLGLADPNAPRGRTTPDYAETQRRLGRGDERSPHPRHQIDPG